jgi:hypothetical protein
VIVRISPGILRLHGPWRAQPGLGLFFTVAALSVRIFPRVVSGPATYWLVNGIIDKDIILKRPVWVAKREQSRRVCASCSRQYLSGDDISPFTFFKEKLS